MSNLSVNIKDILQAQKRLRPIVHNTPIIRSRTFSSMTGVETYLKLENLQRGGSFKIRGAFNKLSSLKKEIRKKGVVAASAGNHAQGVALAANTFGVHTTIVMPEHAPISKQSAVLGYGATLLLKGSNFEEAYAEAQRIAKKENATLIETYNDETLLAGHGTIALEILKLQPDIDTMIVPIGGGGLISGVGIAAKAIKPKLRIIGVQAERISSVYRSFLKGGIAVSKPRKTIADGIAIREPGSITFPIIQKVVDDILTVSEEEIASSILLLMERKKIIVEGAGATPLAGLLSKKISRLGKKVALILSGGNIDVNLLERIIEKGLMKTGRLLLLKTEIPDTPGALGELTTCLGHMKANILDITHDRISTETDIGLTGIKTTLETHGKEHNRKIVRELRKRGYKLLKQ